MDRENILKRDLFGEVALDYVDGKPLVTRNAAASRWWTRWLARYLMRREARALATLDGIGGVPSLVSHEGNRLVRSYLDGQPLHVARPDAADWFKAAATLLRRIHRAGVTHNDLAKEPNLLVRGDGSPGIIDFQLAGCSHSRSKLFRIAAYEDIRHLLKHKRTYRPDLLTRRELRILANPSPASRFWMGTVKPLYLFITRRLLGWADREGAADRSHK
jgi:RIO-like serine/threonine protein kinase